MLAATRREIDQQPLSAAGDDVPSVIVICLLRLLDYRMHAIYFIWNYNQYATLYGESESPDSHDGRFHNAF